MKTISMFVLTTALLSAPAFAAEKAPQKIQLSVTEEGIAPSPVKVNKDQPVTLVITRKTDATCATAIVVDAKDVKNGKELKTDLPLNKPVEVRFTPAHSGEIKYGCAMGKMLSGVLLVE